MIVITGPGRSGTSVLASAYKAAGVDPGGEWDYRANAGLETPEVTTINDRIISDLGLWTLGVKHELPGLDHFLPREAVRKIKEVIPADRRKSLRRRLQRSWWNQARTLRLFPWDMLETVAMRHGDAIRSCAESQILVKDPRFSWTLPVWLHADATIEHVVITTRDVSDMVESRKAAGHLAFAQRTDAQNSMIYAIGLVLTTCLDSGTKSTLLRFPDFLTDPDATAAALPLPVGITHSDLTGALTRVIDPAKVVTNAVRTSEWRTS